LSDLCESDNNRYINISENILGKKDKSLLQTIFEKQIYEK